MAGETTSLSASAARQFYDNYGAGVFLVPFSLTFSSTNNELNDVMEAGYLPAFTRVVAVIWAPTDMDTNGTPTVAHKVTVGSTDIVTGLTGAQTGAASLTVCTQASIVAATSSSPQLVKVTSTAAAATAAAGTAMLLLLCQHAAS
jgi:hypothetical protein